MTKNYSGGDTAQVNGFDFPGAHCLITSELVIKSPRSVHRLRLCKCNILESLISFATAASELKTVPFVVFQFSYFSSSRCFPRQQRFAELN